MQRNEKYLYVIDEQRQFYQHINEANDHLETKASAILQSGSFITGLISAAKLVTGTTASALATVTLIAVLILFFAMLVLSLLVWLPKGYTAPGKAKWTAIFEKHINADDENDLTQTLSNYLAAIDAGLAQNKRQSQLVKWAGISLGAQIIALIILLFAS